MVNTAAIFDVKSVINESEEGPALRRTRSSDCADRVKAELLGGSMQDVDGWFP
jgi:hypothetical protein